MLAKGGYMSNHSEYTCPKCQCPTYEIDTGNGGELFVAEDMDGSTECYEPDIRMYQCSNDKKHIFYMPG